MMGGGVVVIMEIDSWVTRVLSVPTVSELPQPWDTTIVVGGGVVGGSGKSSTASLLLMAVGTALLLEASSLLLPGSAAVGVASFSGTKAAFAPVTLHWTIVWGLHPDPSMATTLTGVAAALNCVCGYYLCPSAIPPPLCIPICPPSDVLIHGSLGHVCVLSRGTFVEL